VGKDPPTCGSILKVLNEMPDLGTAPLPPRKLHTAILSLRRDSMFNPEKAKCIFGFGPRIQ